MEVDWFKLHILYVIYSCMIKLQAKPIDSFNTSEFILIDQKYKLLAFS